ncbi:AAA family ATPase [Phosphitispora sp. TUW77]|uniref:AAA family ATPase n=1 Tax=Phosphitispora sp. TUW77 TaxID=3152361 RepID=UPI003AB83B8D
MAVDISIEQLKQSFEQQGYIADQETIVTVFLALKLEKPLLVEGPPGVGKTEIAKVLAAIFEAELIRLQCYEGLDENKALYEWNYQKQLIRIQLSQVNRDARHADIEDNLFSEEYLLERPLLKAIRTEKTPVLLIDEIDKVDQEFEAFLFEVLSDFQVSIPEWGTLKARQIPIVILTSNAEREISDGLKRRCIYLYLDFPSPDKELRIINAKVPGIGQRLSLEIARAVNVIREELLLRKKPSIAETLDWARAVAALDADRLTPDAVKFSLNLIFKNKDDIDTFNQNLGTEGLISFLNENRQPGHKGRG